MSAPAGALSSSQSSQPGSQPGFFCPPAEHPVHSAGDLWFLALSYSRVYGFPCLGEQPKPAGRAPPGALLFVSRQKGGKKRLPLRGACGRDGALLPTPLDSIQPHSISVATIASPVAGLATACLLPAPFCAVRGSGVLKAFKNSQRRSSLRIAACRNNHHPAQMEPTKTRRPYLTGGSSDTPPAASPCRRQPGLFWLLF